MIEATGLTRDFVTRKNTVHAVRSIDLHVDRGETVAVLGPNGAGKTTTMRMLTTLLRPTSGSARVAGFDVDTDPDQVRRRLGYVGQGNGAGHNQRALDELACQGVVFGMSRDDARTRAQDLMSSLDLAGKEKAKVSELSGGQRRRLDVAMGLMHAPELLVLDEPSTGLDPHNRANLWEHIQALRAEHDMTLLLTTHYLDEADTMAERVVIIDHGQIIADDTPEALKQQHAGDLISVTTEGPDAAARLADHLQVWRSTTSPPTSTSGHSTSATSTSASSTSASSTSANPTSSVETRGSTVVATVAHGSRRVAELVHLAEGHGIPLLDVQVRRPTLDDVFLNLTGRSLREAGASADDSEAAA
ncbi:ABC transporter ATP-binding protein [Ornithinimicrobium sp. Y1847]|uniref:ABC transporter ATP-binding protein n=1 Tax=Ornithinimicrobium sp. Y1847 TaxID=3405419 RepID=UPI003B66CF45